jgi:uncharacterized protein YaaR (DUF327 family)
MLIPSDIENMVPKSVPIQINSNRLNTKAKSSSSSQSSNFSQTARSTSVHHEHKPEFLDLLESIAPKNKEETKDIHDLWKELPGIERDLIDDRSPINLTRYKNQVNSLLKAILLTNNSIKTQYTPIRGSNAKKEFSHIEYFDEKLKLLAETITHPQNSAFQILKQLDNIKGFLLDIQR